MKRTQFSKKHKSWVGQTRQQHVQLTWTYHPKLQLIVTLVLNRQINIQFHWYKKPTNKPVNVIEIHRIHLLATEEKEKKLEQRKFMSEIHLPVYSLENTKVKLYI